MSLVSRSLDFSESSSYQNAARLVSGPLVGDALILGSNVHRVHQYFLRACVLPLDPQQTLSGKSRGVD